MMIIVMILLLLLIVLIITKTIMPKPSDVEPPGQAMFLRSIVSFYGFHFLVVVL